jgi:hypothetical protein
VWVVVILTIVAFACGVLVSLSGGMKMLVGEQSGSGQQWSTMWDRFVDQVRRQQPPVSQQDFTGPDKQAPGPSPSASPAVTAKTGRMPHPAVIPKFRKVNGTQIDASYQPTDAELADTAFVTMAAGDDAGRMAVALMQSLRDVETRVPNLVVMLMIGGVGSAHCHGARRNCAVSRREEDIIQPEYIAALRRLKVNVTVLDPLPPTEFTNLIAGGPVTFWGMAFNKLRVFGMTEYRRITWLDSDTLVLRNIDHLMVQPEFTAAFTNDCNNGAASYKISGGIWSFIPSQQRMDRIFEITRTGELGDGQEWRLGDMEIVLFLFAEFTRASRENGFWPSSYDMRQGRTPGLELFDKMYAPWGEYAGRVAGPLPEKVKPLEEKGQAYWHPLDVRYDYLADECRGLPWRYLGLPADSAAELGLVAASPGRPWGDAETLASPGLPVQVHRMDKDRAPWKPIVTPTGYDDGQISLHFSCVQPPLSKPGHISTEVDLVDMLKSVNKPCVSQQFMLWYSKFQRGMGGGNAALSSGQFVASPEKLALLE